jgi:ABC-type dipeptide/oligopeptide/nickel transport system permease subunit
MSSVGSSTPGFDAKQHLSPNQRAWLRFRRNRLALISLCFLTLLVAMVVLWPILSKRDPNKVSPDQFKPPSITYLCGTDVHGHDLLSRMFAGARISLLVGIVGAAVSLVIGVTWGSIAGYKSGRWDGVMMRVVDILYALPAIVFVIVLISTFEGLLKRWGSSTVDRNDFKDVRAFVVKLRDPGATVSAALLAGFTPELRGLVSGFTANGEPDEESQKKLTEELNKVLTSSFFFQETIFAGVRLRGKTKSALEDNKRAGEQVQRIRKELDSLPPTNLLSSAQNKLKGRLERDMGEAITATTGAALARLNRLLMEDAFPGELKHRETWFTRVMLGVFSPRFGASTQMIFLFVGLGAVSWLTMARIVRGQVLSLRTRQFVDASRALGASHARILLRHILPNVTGIIIVYLALTVPAIILYESFLSFLGLGIQPPMASWGSLIAEGANQLNPIRIYWWLIVFPAAMMVTTLLALNFLGDGLRDAFDPRAQT